MQPAPPLPPFIARQLPFRRFVHTLESGPDAGRRIHFIDEGEPGARPVLMLHGNPTWSFLWRKVITLLPGFRCVAPDLLGLVLSDRLPRLSDHAPERHAGALAGLVEALDLRGLILVGQDWGGSFGALMASRVPDRVAGAVFANTVVSMPSHPRRSLFHKLSHLPGVSSLLFRGLGFPVNLLWMAQGDRRSISGAVARAYRWPLSAWADRAAPLALARLVPSRQDATWETLRQGGLRVRGCIDEALLVLAEPGAGGEEEPDDFEAHARKNRPSLAIATTGSGFRLLSRLLAEEGPVPGFRVEILPCSPLIRLVACAPTTAEASASSAEP